MNTSIYCENCYLKLGLRDEYEEVLNGTCCHCGVKFGGLVRRVVERTIFHEATNEPGVFGFETTIGGEHAHVFVQPPIGDKRPGKIDSHLAGVHGKTSVEWARGDSHREAARKLVTEMRKEADRLVLLADDLRGVASKIVLALDHEELP